MAKLSPPENFDFTKPAEWPQWKTHFERYRIASKLNNEEVNFKGFKENEIKQITRY